MVPYCFWFFNAISTILLWFRALDMFTRERICDCFLRNRVQRVPALSNFIENVTEALEFQVTGSDWNTELIQNAFNVVNLGAIRCIGIKCQLVVRAGFNVAVTWYNCFTLCYSSRLRGAVVLPKVSLHLTTAHGLLLLYPWSDYRTPIEMGSFRLVVQGLFVGH